MKFGDHDFTVKELTVAQVRELLEAKDAASKESKDSKDQLFDLFDDIDFEDMCAITGCDKADFDPLPTSQLRRLADECKAKNSHFFNQRQRRARQLREFLDDPGKIGDILQHTRKLSELSNETPLS